MKEQTPHTQATAKTTVPPQIGTSDFVLVYHRSPYDETIDAEGKRKWVDQKSPNGIIPTLRSLFQEVRSCAWISWREDSSESIT